jgi:PAS domain S-box-containing protein
MNINNTSNNIIRQVVEFISISSVGIFLADTRGKLLKFNDPLLRLLQLSSEDEGFRLYDGNAINFFSDKHYLENLFSKLNRQNPTFNGFISIITSANENVRVSLTVQLISDSAESFIVGYVTTLPEEPTNEISALKNNSEVENELKDHQKFIYTIDAEGNLTDAGDAFFKFINLKKSADVKNYRRTDLINPFYNFLHLKDLEFIERAKKLNGKSSDNYVENEVSDHHLVRRTAFFDDSHNLKSVSVFLSHFSELINIEKVIPDSFSQQQTILDNIPYLAWLKNDSGKYVSVNNAFAKFFKKKPEEIIGKTDRKLFPIEIAEKQESYYAEILDTGIRKLTEDTWKIDDEEHWVEVYIAPLFSKDGKITGITGIARDISDRKAIENSIIENEEHFRSLLQYSSDAITILDSDGFIVFESSLRNRISDFMIDELVGRPYQEIIHPDDVPIFREILHEILNGKETQIKREYRSLHKNKKWIYVESIFSNHLNNPSINGIVVNTRDISDRKMSDLKERVYHDNLIFLSNSALDLLGLSDRDDIIKYIGDKLHSFLEDSIVLVSTYSDNKNIFTIKHVVGLGKFYSKVNELIGVNLNGTEFSIKVIPYNPENAGQITIFNGSIDDLNLGIIQSSAIKTVLKILRTNKIYNITMARDNKLLGNITILTLNKTIIKFKHIIETFVHQVSVALHRSQLEYELVKAKTKAEESDMLKTAFLANMSHEIRTPMNGILGFAEMLNDEFLSEGNRKKYVEIINNNGKMLMSLIDDIIDFAKIEAGQIKILNQEFSLNSLLTQVHSSFLSESLKKEKTNVKLRIRKAFANDECFIQTDPNRLRQVLTNLVGNAFKFTQEGFIEFGYTAPVDGFLEFYVKDTGIGIPKDKIDLIFERFVQADYSRSRKYSGSGLGLAISKGFIDLLGGKMWAESEVNLGSTFYFTIPYRPALTKTQEEIERSKPKSDYDWHNKCFLIAEDDKFSFKLLEGFLKKTNAEIIHAIDGVEAVDKCRENSRINLVLMDVQMPEMNGLEATKIIKQFRTTLPIIAQTANAIAEERQKCFEAGFDDFITKPINISELLSKIDKWLVLK